MVNTPFPRHRLHLVLRHDHVLGRGNKIIHSSVTQIDLHDFSRLCLTYGLAGFHCITEMPAQHQIAADILNFWQEGYGRDYNPDRKAALKKLHLHQNFEQFLEKIRELEGSEPLLIGSSAQPTDKNLDFQDLSTIMIRSDRPAVLQLGTSWGLSSDQLSRCDGILPPIVGQHGYNHLSVRCAAAILVDRICQSHITD